MSTSSFIKEVSVHSLSVIDYANCNNNAVLRPTCIGVPRYTRFNCPRFHIHVKKSIPVLTTAAHARFVARAVPLTRFTILIQSCCFLLLQSGQYSFYEFIFTFFQFTRPFSEAQPPCIWQSPVMTLTLSVKKLLTVLTDTLRLLEVYITETATISKDISQGSHRIFLPISWYSRGD
jgi:hypothetical protein